MRYSHTLRSNHHIPLTADKGFSNILQFLLGMHNEIVVMRLPNTASTTEVNRTIISELKTIEGQSLRGAWAIIDTRSIRMRPTP